MNYYDFNLEEKKEKLQVKISLFTVLFIVIMGALLVGCGQSQHVDYCSNPPEDSERKVLCEQIEQTWMRYAVTVDQYPDAPKDAFKEVAHNTVDSLSMLIRKAYDEEIQYSVRYIEAIGAAHNAIQ